jgi:myosin-crossreactive antigen
MDTSPTRCSELVVKFWLFRNRPPVGFDSILTGERDVDHIGIYSHQRHNELQYLVFDSKQVRSEKHDLHIFWMMSECNENKQVLHDNIIDSDYFHSHVLTISLNNAWFQAIPVYLVYFTVWNPPFWLRCFNAKIELMKDGVKLNFAAISNFDAVGGRTVNTEQPSVRTLLSALHCDWTLSRRVFRSFPN